MVAITLSIAVEYEDTYRPNTGKNHSSGYDCRQSGGLGRSASQQRHETLLPPRCLPNERYQATPHLVPVSQVTGQFLGEQFLLIEDSPYQRGHHQEKYQEVPPRPERKAHADEQEKASHVHRMTHQPVHAVRYNFLLGMHLYRRRGKSIFFVHDKYDQKADRDKNISG